MFTSLISFLEFVLSIQVSSTVISRQSNQQTHAHRIMLPSPLPMLLDHRAMRGSVSLSRKDHHSIAFFHSMAMSTAQPAQTPVSRSRSFQWLLFASIIACNIYIHCCRENGWFDLQLQYEVTRGVCLVYICWCK